MFHRVNAFICLSATLATLYGPGKAIGSEILLRQAITAELRYDTNANLSGNDQTANSDTVVVFAPQFEVINDRGRITLSALYRPTGYYYLKQPEINTINHYAMASMNTQPSQNTTFELSDVFTYTKESLEASLINVQTGRSGIVSNTVSTGMGYHATENTELSLNMSDNVLDFKDPYATDTRTDSASAGIRYAATERTSLNTTYTYTNFSFKHLGQPGHHLSTQSLSAGITHIFPYDLTVDMSGGAVYAPSITGRYDWVASAGITKTFQHSLFSINYSRSTTNSAGLTDEINLNERYGVRLSHSITDRIEASVSGEYVFNHTKPVAVVDMTSYDVVVSGIWRAKSWLTFGAGYSHFKQISRGTSGIDFKRDHFFVNLTATTFEQKF